MAVSGSPTGDRPRAAHLVRRDDRQSEHERHELQARLLVRQAIPELWDPDERLDPLSMPARYTKILGQLDAAPNLSWKGRRAALKWLAAEVEERNVRDRADLPCPPVSALLKRDPPRVTESLFKAGSLLLATHDALLIALSAMPVEALDDLTLLRALLIFFATTHGGLLEDDALVHLVNYAGELELVHNTALALTYVELDLRATGRPLANDRNGESDRLIRRWFPDPLSLAVILRIRRLRRESGTTKAKLTVPDCVKLLNESVSSLVSGAPRFQSLRRFCKVATVVSEVQADVPEVLLNVAQGRVPSVGHTPAGWLAYLDCNPVTPPDGTALLAPLVQRPAPPAPRPGRTSRASSADYAVLSKELHRHRTGSHAQMAAALEAIPADRLSLAGADLRQWYLYHLRTMGNRPTSIHRYHIEIGAAWTSAVVGLDPANLTESELGDLVETLLEKRKSKRNYFRGRLLDFLDFCRRELGYSGLDRTFARDRRAENVRAAFVSRRMLYAALRPLRESGTREREIVFFILMYRLGLRPGELAGLRVEDLEASDELRLRIRGNWARDLKRTTSVRVVPCASLLPERERAFVLRFLRSVQESCTDQRHFVFAPPMNPTQPENVRYFGTLLSALMKDAGYPGVCQYDLRHTALSTMQLIVEQEYALTAVTGYRPDECETIRRVLVNPTATGQDDYFALARFAGHCAPDTSFASYLHFGELLLHRRLERTASPLPIPLVSKVAGISELALTRAARRGGAADARIPAATARSLIEREHMSEFVRQKPGTPLADNPLLANSESDAPPPRILADAWLKILEECETNKPLIEICAKHSVDLHDLERKLANARLLNYLPSRKRAPRHVSAERRRDHETRLTPPDVPDKAVHNEVNALIARLRSQWKTRRDDITWAVCYYFTHSTSTHPGIIFHDPADLRRLVDLMQAEVPYARWRIRLRPPPDGSWQQYAAKWQVRSRLTVEKDRPLRKADRYSHGIARLSLRHPNEADRLKGVGGKPGQPPPQSFSVRTPEIALFLIGIIVFEPAELEDQLRSFAGGSGALSSEPPGSHRSGPTRIVRAAGR
jgi:integrase